MKVFDPWVIYMLLSILMSVSLYIFYLATKSDDEQN